MFNNPYMNYTPYSNQYSYQPQQNSNSTTIQYVNSIDSAKAFQIPPNSSVLLMDSTMDRFYVKKSDASGFSTIDAYDFHKVDNTTPANDFVSRQEFEELRTKISKYEELLAQLS